MKYGKGELVLKVLYMVSVGALIPASILAPNIPKAVEPLLKKLSKKIDTNQQSFRRSLAYAKKHRLVTVQEKGDTTMLVLSENGKRRIVEGNINTLEISKPRTWDKKWRVVLFDIPEKQKPAREALRNTLSRMGFLQIQKSCFVHPFECRDELDFISEFFDVSPHVRYIEAQYLEGEEELKKHFWS